MSGVKNFLIIVNTGSDKPYNQYASYVLAFVAKQLQKVENVTIFYGPEGVRMTKKGELAKLSIPDPVKKLVADQIDGLSAGDLPDNLEQLARFENKQLGITIASCGTFHVIDGFAGSIDDKSKIEDFIVPLTVPQAAEALLNADKVHYL